MTEKELEKYIEHNFDFIDQTLRYAEGWSEDVLRRKKARTGYIKFEPIKFNPILFGYSESYDDTMTNIIKTELEAVDSVLRDNAKHINEYIKLVRET